MEFDFTVKYRKGAANTVADCVSQLPTFHESSWTPDLDIPCYLVAQDPESLLKLETFNVGEDQPRTEKRKAELRDDFDLEDFEESSRILAAEPEAELSPITPEELLRAQSVDPTCIDIRSRLEEGVSLPYRTNSQRLLTRLSPWDDHEQIFVPPSLRAKALALAHYPAVAGHPGSTRMYQSLRREFYWPNMALDTHECVRNCSRCAKERINLKAHFQFLKLFPTSRPLEFVAIDILGPLTKTAQGNRFLLVMSDRYSKLAKSVPLASLSSYRVARAFCEHWIFAYGPPSYLLSDKGGQFTAKFFQHVCNILGIRNLYTTTYHPQTKGQVERFNRTCSEKMWAELVEQVKSLSSARPQKNHTTHHNTRL